MITNENITAYKLGVEDDMENHNINNNSKAILIKAEIIDKPSIIDNIQLLYKIYNRKVPKNYYGKLSEFNKG